MTTFVTINPHYCDLRYGESVSDRIFYMKTFGMPRRLPLISNIFIGLLNSFRLPDDDVYFPEGPAELYPLFYRRTNSKVVATLKDNTLFNMQFMPSGKRNFLVKLVSLCDGIIVDTNYMKSLVEKFFCIPVKTHPPFCAQPFFDAEPNLEKKNIIFIGDANAQKGFNELARAMEFLPDWNLYLVGTCGRAVDFTGKNIHVEGFQKGLRPYFESCSLYVHPAHFDVFGVAALEAMSAGVIPVVSEMTGVSEVLVSEGMKKLVIMDNSPETIAEKVNEISSWSDTRKRRLSSKCRNIVRRNFTEKTNVARFKEIFNSFL